MKYRNKSFKNFSFIAIVAKNIRILKRRGKSRFAENCICAHFSPPFHGFRIVHKSSFRKRRSGRQDALYHILSWQNVILNIGKVAESWAPRNVRVTSGHRKSNENTWKKLTRKCENLFIRIAGVLLFQKKFSGVCFSNCRAPHHVLRGEQNDIYRPKPNAQHVPYICSEILWTHVKISPVVCENFRIGSRNAACVEVFWNEVLLWKVSRRRVYYSRIDSCAWLNYFVVIGVMKNFDCVLKTQKIVVLVYLSSYQRKFISNEIATSATKYNNWLLNCARDHKFSFGVIEFVNSNFFRNEFEMLYNGVSINIVVLKTVFNTK